ncbi:MAG: hypothetical protein IJN63_06760 [Clostridia bacterium]|nr:hypothetical protein [Clostridia bacterium]
MKKHCFRNLAESNDHKGLLSRNATKKERLSAIPWLAVFPIYLLSYFAVEAIVPTTDYWVSYIPLDDHIPFVEQYVVFYVMWYALLAVTGLYLLLFNGEGLKKYCAFIGIGFFTVLIFSLFFPNGQDLRPDLATLGRENVFTRILEGIYAADTNTNVIPSMHVIGCCGIIFAFWEARELRPFKWPAPLMTFLCINVILSTTFVKQHSILDTFTAIPFSIFVYLLVYKVIFKRRKKQ